MKDRISAGIYPCGIVYADKSHEVAGDYKRLAFLDYATLRLDLEPDCPPELARQIKADAAPIQARRGESFQVSTCGQTVILGSALKTEPVQPDLFPPALMPFNLVSQ